VQRVFAPALLFAAAAALWLAVFLAIGNGVIWVIQTYEENSASECDRGECGTFGEIVDDHSLVFVIAVGLVAVLPSATLLWATRRRVGRDNANPS
jgi:hypothetical protein